MAAIGPATSLSPLISALDFSVGEDVAQPLCVLNREADNLTMVCVYPSLLPWAGP